MKYTRKSENLKLYLTNKFANYGYTFKRIVNVPINCDFTQIAVSQCREMWEATYPNTPSMQWSYHLGLQNVFSVFGALTLSELKCVEIDQELTNDEWYVCIADPSLDTKLLVVYSEGA